MFISKKSYFVLAILFLNLLLLASCDKKEEVEPNYPKRMNYFSMEVDGELWQPSFINGDTCKQTFKGIQSGISKPKGIIPFYNIDAFQNLNDTYNFTLKNFIRMQIMDVTQVGRYKIKNSYKIHYDSFVSFEKVKDENGNDIKSIYTIDSTKNTFNFYVDEIINLNSLGANQGIIGHFEGILYNIKNPADSVIITNGQYKFTRLNWIDDCHCEK
jgi:hypothetical protein